MPNAPHHPRPELNGYLYFDDPDWWHCFTVTGECAQAIEEFRQAVNDLELWSGEELDIYEAMMSELWETSERVVNQMQWHAKRDIVVIVELAQLYQACIDRTAPVNFRTECIRNNLKMKAASIRSLLSTMHDVHVSPI